MLRVFSYGGGVQSTAALVLAANGRLDYQTFIFANVGDDSEHPDTLRYVRAVAMPYAREKGIELLELSNARFGKTETLYQRLMRPDRSIGIPVRMSNGAPGTRACTKDFKIKVIDARLRELLPKGSTQARRKALLTYCGIKKIDKQTMPIVLKKIDAFLQEYEPLAEVGLGISLDEFQRMKPNMAKETIAWKINDFPLIEQRLDRQACMNIIRGSGLPVPPKSSCWFCPFHSMRKWQEMREEEPELFWKAAKLEEYINHKRNHVLGKDMVWLTPKLKPLAQATTELTMDSLFEDDGCDSGYCFM